jgi:hypothetical protein
MALAGARDASPEAAGIYRISQPNADPAEGEAEPLPAGASTVPLPRRRPALATVISARGMLTLAAAAD